MANLQSKMAYLRNVIAYLLTVIAHCKCAMTYWLSKIAHCKCVMAYLWSEIAHLHSDIADPLGEMLAHLPEETNLYLKWKSVFKEKSINDIAINMFYGFKLKFLAW